MIGKLTMKSEENAEIWKEWKIKIHYNSDFQYV
jgi:hypothetical protein